MPRIFARPTGRHLGDLNEREYTQLMSLFSESPGDKQPASIGPDAVDRLAGSGASERLLMVVQEILQGCEDFEVEWEPDPD